MLWSLSNCMAGFYRLLAYAVPTMVVANAAGGLALLFLMITNGAVWERGAGAWTRKRALQGCARRTAVPSLAAWASHTACLPTHRLLHRARLHPRLAHLGLLVRAAAGRPPGGGRRQGAASRGVPAWEAACARMPWGAAGSCRPACPPPPTLPRINPLSWAVRGIVANELGSPAWDIPITNTQGASTTGACAAAEACCCTLPCGLQARGSHGTLHPSLATAAPHCPRPGCPWSPAHPAVGKESADQFDFFLGAGWVWGSVALSWGWLVLFTIAGAVALQYSNPASPRPTGACSRVRTARAGQRGGHTPGPRSLCLPLNSPTTTAPLCGAVSDEDSKAEVERSVLSTLSRSSMQPPSPQPSMLPRTSTGSGPELPTSTGSGPVLPTSTSSGPAAAPAAAAAAGGAQGGAEGAKPAGDVVPFTPITLVCRDIRYYVADPSQGKAPGVVKGSADEEIEGKLELLKVGQHSWVGGQTAALPGRELRSLRAAWHAAGQAAHPCCPPTHPPLQGISMYAEPGTLTALMVRGGTGRGREGGVPGVHQQHVPGVQHQLAAVNAVPSNQRLHTSIPSLQGGSGAGKTTLMDVILGRKTVGLIRGDILVNGHPKVQATWSRVAGYVEQQVGIWGAGGDACAPCGGAMRMDGPLLSLSSPLPVRCPAPPARPPRRTSTARGPRCARRSSSPRVCAWRRTLAGSRCSAPWIPRWR